MSIEGSEAAHLENLLKGYRAYVRRDDFNPPDAKGSAREVSYSAGWELAEKDIAHRGQVLINAVPCQGRLNGIECGQKPTKHNPTTDKWLCADHCASVENIDAIFREVERADTPDRILHDIASARGNGENGTRLAVLELLERAVECLKKTEDHLWGHKHGGKE